ncbi:MAG: hypothetical protein JKX71_14640 [Amylibacter sp.]|nr:hypothetical protein [Amylibacter sp.]
MSDIAERRKFLTFGATFVGLGLTSQAGFAGIGSESDRAGLEHAKRLETVKYSQDEFMELSHHELTYLYNYKINGFYEAMASNVVKMALDDRASLHKLMRDMAGLQADDARKTRLLAELRQVKSRRAALGKRSSAGNRHQFRRAKGYERGVKMWLASPREGTYFVSCMFSIGNKSWGCNS